MLQASGVVLGTYVMPNFQPTEWIAISSVLVAAIAAVMAIAAPWYGWRLARRSQLDDQKRHTQLSIFAQLMQNRHIALSREAVQALNLIDVAFHDNSDVRFLWREYHALINNSAFFESPVGNELRNQKLSSLQAAMAKALGYSIDAFDIQRVYVPNWLVDEQTIAMHDREARLAAIRRLAPSSTPPSNTSPDALQLDGTYLARFKDPEGRSGVGVVTLSAGVVTGGSNLAGRFLGKYQVVGGRMMGSVEISVPESASIEGKTLFASDVDWSLPLEDGEKTISAAGVQFKLNFRRLPAA